MIAAVRRRIGRRCRAGVVVAPVTAVDRRWSGRSRDAARLERRPSRPAALAKRLLRRAIARSARRPGCCVGRLGRRLRPLGVLAPARAWRCVERRRCAAPRPGRVRAATRASAVLTPQRAICADDPRRRRLPGRRAVRRLPRGRDRPAGLRRPAGGAARRRSTRETAGDAHAYLLVPVALLAAVLALAALRNERRRGSGRSSSRSACSASPSSSSSTCPPGSTPVRRPRASPAPGGPRRRLLRPARRSRRA